jgi:hypothetical protein
MRKKRSDRNHVIYKITCIPTGECYIGLTVVRGRAFLGSIKTRWQGHVYHAIIENRQNPLQKRIRQYGEESFQQELIKIIRGKKQAHNLERELIKINYPELNVCCKN